jgi:myo-inositol-1(or 4)-monophosphatase
MPTTNQPTLSQVVAWAKEAGAIARNAFHTEHTLGFKSATDVVTEVDHQCEKVLMDHIRSSFHSHSILTEESGALSGRVENRWYIDPLDGTINYSHCLPTYTVSIAYEADGVIQLGVVYDPSRDECFSAGRGAGAWLNGEPMHVSDCISLQKSLLSTGFPYHNPEKFDLNLKLFGHLTRTTQGVRRLGSAALDICYVACGRMDGYWDQEINAWDIAAGVLIVEEAGGMVTGLKGEKEYFKPPYAVVACAPGIHRQMLDTFMQVK